MKHNVYKGLMTASVLVLALALLSSCNTVPPSGTESSLPDTLEVTEPTTSTGTPDLLPTVSSVVYGASALPDYDAYTARSRIKEVLGGQKTFAFTLGGTKYYANGELKDGGEDLVSISKHGNVILNNKKLRDIVGNSKLRGEHPQVVAWSLGMGYAVYDNKLVLFYENEAPLHPYDDMYTFEAMHLYMAEAEETEIVNAFIDLPSLISNNTNNTNNTIFYTSPDLNLGVQTSVYYAQMGQTNNLTPAPALVAGEGKHESNYTTIRVFNNQNVCTTQFLAFDASVKGGVQVAAAKVGEEVLIATAPYAAHEGADGDIRVFDPFGMIRMTMNIRDAIPGPHTIVTGHFAEGVDNEVLLVASQTTNEKGELPYVIISLADGSVISNHTLDCSFALTGDKAGVPVALSVRNTAAKDSVILYFHSVQAVYEGDAQNGKFDNAKITLPTDAVHVSASTVEGQKYIASVAVREGEENLSYVVIYDGTSSDGKLVDVGFRENRFFSNMATDYNDDRYVGKGDFCHVRTDSGNSVISGIGSSTSADRIDSIFAQSSYADYRSTSIESYVNRLSSEYLMLEPCFTHRWHKIPSWQALIDYKDPYDGIQKYASIGKDTLMQQVRSM